jgi:hypothetical protein
VMRIRYNIIEYSSLKSRGLTAWLWLFFNASRAKAPIKPSSRPGLARPIWARLGPAHGLRPGQAQHYFQHVYFFIIYFTYDLYILVLMYIDIYILVLMYRDIY